MEYATDPFECRYASADDIRTKLHGSMIMFGNEPVQVTTGNYPNYKKLDLGFVADTGGISRYEQDINVNDPRINQYEFNLGWFNLVSPRTGGRSLAYGERLPVRRWKQGLCIDSVMINVYSKGGVSTRCQPTQGELATMMRGKYPTLDEMLDQFRSVGKAAFNSGGFGCALSHEVALLLPDEMWTAEVCYFNVYVGKVLVGRYHPKSRTIESTKEGMFSVVSETLRQVGIR